MVALITLILFSIGYGNVMTQEIGLVMPSYEHLNPYLISYKLPKQQSTLPIQQYTIIDEQIDTLQVTLDPMSPQKSIIHQTKEINLQFQIDLQTMAQSAEDVKPDQSDTPIAYKIDNIKSIKEDKIKLTAPIFCQLSPLISGFNVTTNFKIFGDEKIRVEDNLAQMLVLDDIIIYLTDSQPFFQVLQIQTDKISGFKSLKQRKKTELFGKYKLTKSSPFISLTRLPLQKNYFLASKGDDQVYLFKVLQNSVPDSIDFNSDTNQDEIQIEFYLIDTLEAYIASNTREVVLGMFNGAKLKTEILEKITQIEKTQEYMITTEGYIVVILTNGTIVVNELKGQKQPYLSNITNSKQIMQMHDIGHSILLIIDESESLYEVSIDDNLQMKLIRQQALDISGVIVDSYIDEKFLYLASNESTLTLIKHSVPPQFSMQSSQLMLPHQESLVSYHLIQDQHLISNQTHITLISSYHQRTQLTCESYPKPNLYQVSISAFLTSNDACKNLLLSKSIIISGRTKDSNQTSGTESGCVVKKAYQVNVDYPEGFMQQIERQRNGLKIGTIIGSVLGCSAVIALIAGVAFLIINRNLKKEKIRKQGETDRYVGDTKPNYDMHFDEQESNDTSSNNGEIGENGYQGFRRLPNQSFSQGEKVQEFF